MKKLPLERDFYPQILTNQVINQFQNIGQTRQKIYHKKPSHQKGSLSCLIQLFRLDQVEKMIKSPAKRLQGRNSLSQFIDRPSTNLLSNKTPQKQIQTQTILDKAQKLHFSLTDLQKQIKIRQEYIKCETLSRMTSQLNSIPFYNIQPKFHPLNQKNLNKIKSIKAKLNKIKSRPILNPCFNFYGQTSIQKDRLTKVKTSKSSCQIQSKNTNSNVNQNGNYEQQVLNQGHLGSKKLKIQDFLKVCRLGSGVYGIVSLYRHKISNFLTAIKVIPKAKLDHADHIYLTRQIKLQTFAYHPNIAQIYTFFDDADFIYLVLEFCNEGNLYDMIQKQGGKLAESQIKKYMKNICQAVALLHEKSIIHRDLKPQNILVSNGVAKLCDFGWAVKTPDMRETLCGTPLYSSPQQIKNQHYDSKIDIWSIGIMTYEFIYGKGPFDIRNREDLSKVVEKDVEFGGEYKISKQCKDFINGCLQKDPRDRFEIWQLLGHAFLRQEEKIRDSIKVSVVKNSKTVN